MSNVTVKLDVMRQKRRISVTGKVPDREGVRTNRVHRPGDDRRGSEG